MWTTYSVISGWIFGIVFAADFAADNSVLITLADLNFFDNKVYKNLYFYYINYLTISINVPVCVNSLANSDSDCNASQ